MLKIFFMSETLPILYIMMIKMTFILRFVRSPLSPSSQCPTGSITITFRGVSPPPKALWEDLSLCSWRLSPSSSSVTSGHRSFDDRQGNVCMVVFQINTVKHEHIIKQRFVVWAAMMFSIWSLIWPAWWLKRAAEEITQNSDEREDNQMDKEARVGQNHYGSNSFAMLTEKVKLL